MNDEKSWQEIVKKADVYKSLGQVEHYLYDDKDVPWEYVVKCEPGGSHRLDISTSVRFRAFHPSGLKFSWSFDIEFRAANGKGYYEIDAYGIARVMEVLPEKARRSFATYLSDCAVKVRESGDKYRDISRLEYDSAEALERIVAKTSQRVQIAWKDGQK